MTGRGNVNGSRIVQSTYAEQMMVFDRLPAAIKEIMRCAPLALDALQAEAISYNHPRNAAEYLTKAILREYPEWRPGRL